MSASHRRGPVAILVTALFLGLGGCTHRGAEPFEPPRRSPANLVTADDIERHPTTATVEELLVRLVPGVQLQRRADGSIALRSIEPIQASGLTLEQLSEVVRRAYLDASILKAGNDRVLVNIYARRKFRIMVMREDTGSGATNTSGKGVLIHLDREPPLGLADYPVPALAECLSPCLAPEPAWFAEQPGRPADVFVTDPGASCQGSPVS